jgi:polyisoprenoid-binding protein YceI
MLFLAVVAASSVVTLAALAAGPEPTAPTSSGTKAETFEIDTAHSFLLFSVKHLDVGMAYGRFNAFSGEYTFDADDPGASSVSVEIEAESIDTGNSGRDRHLRSPDFFNAKQFPKITFESTSVASKGEGKMEIVGTLSMLGVSRTVTLSVERVGEGSGPRGEYRTGFLASTTIRRSDFRMTYMLDKKPGLGDEVQLTIAIEGVRK